MTDTNTAVTGDSAVENSTATAANIEPMVKVSDVAALMKSFFPDSGAASVTTQPTNSLSNVPTWVWLAAGVGAAWLILK